MRRFASPTTHPGYHVLPSALMGIALVVTGACGSTETSTQTQAQPSSTTALNPSTMVSSAPPSSDPGTTSAPVASAQPSSTVAASSTTGVTLPPPSPAIADGSNKVFVLGDSVILGAEANLPVALKGWDLTFDAKESRFVFKGLDELKGKVGEAKKQFDDERAQAEQKARDAGQPPPKAGPEPTPASVLGRVVVIHLCTNYEATGAFAGWIDQYMTYLKDVDRVVWITCVEWSNGQVEANKAMHAAEGRYPNYVVADWARYARLPGYAYNDGIHLQGPGRQALAELVARAVGPAPAPSNESTITSAPGR